METKRFILVMPEALHRQVKINAALEGKTMTDFINDAIREKVKAENARKQQRAAK